LWLFPISSGTLPTTYSGTYISPPSFPTPRVTLWLFPISAAVAPFQQPILWHIHLLLLRPPSLLTHFGVTFTQSSSNCLSCATHPTHVDRLCIAMRGFCNNQELSCLKMSKRTCEDTWKVIWSRNRGVPLGASETTSSGFEATFPPLRALRPLRCPGSPPNMTLVPELLTVFPGHFPTSILGLYAAPKPVR
jgi:hypothetical protein